MQNNLLRRIQNNYPTPPLNQPFQMNKNLPPVSNKEPVERVDQDEKAEEDWEIDYQMNAGVAESNPFESTAKLSAASGQRQISGKYSTPGQSAYTDVIGQTRSPNNDKLSEIYQKADQFSRIQSHSQSDLSFDKIDLSNNDDLSAFVQGEMNSQQPPIDNIDFSLAQHEGTDYTDLQKRFLDKAPQEDNLSKLSSPSINTPSSVKPVANYGNPAPSLISKFDSKSKTSSSEEIVRPTTNIATCNNSSDFFSNAPIAQGNSADTQYLRDPVMSNDAESFRKFPGPLRCTNKQKVNVDKKIEVYKYYTNMLSKLPENQFLKQLLLTLLKTFLNFTKTNLFDPELETDRLLFTETIQNYLSRNDNIDPVFKETYFRQIELLEKKMVNITNDIDAQTTLFLSLFLRNQHAYLESENSKVISKFVAAQYHIGSPFHTIGLIKLGDSIDIAESEFLMNGGFENWLLILFPCIKFQKFINPSSMTEFLTTLGSSCLQQNNPESLLMAFIILMISDYQDLQIISDILEKNKNLELTQMMETYIFIAKVSKENFDKNNLILSQIFPSMLIYAKGLIDFGLHRQALNYLDFITDNRNSFFHLSKNMAFINEIMTLQELANNNVSAQDDQKKGSHKGSHSSDGENTIKAAGFGLLSFVSNKIEQFMAPDESSAPNTRKTSADPKPQKEEVPQCYYDKELKQWIINGKPPEDEEPAKKAEKNEPLAPPPIVKPTEPKSHNQESSTSIKVPPIDRNPGNAFSPSNPHPVGNTAVPSKEKSSTPFGQVTIPGKPNESNPVVTTKKVFQNRYISNFSSQS